MADSTAKGKKSCVAHNGPAPFSWLEANDRSLLLRLPASSGPII